MKNSRKGSYIVEAAIVLPMVILAVITLVLIIMFFYSQVTERSAMHIALRHGAGEAAGKTVYTGVEEDGGKGDLTDESDTDVYVDRGIVESEAYGKRYLMLENRGLLEKRSPFIIEGKCVAVDGAAYIRYRNVIKVTGDEK